MVSIKQSSRSTSLGGRVWEKGYAPHLQSTVLVAGDLVVAVAVTIQRSEHNTERSSPLTEEDEEVVSQGLLGEEEAPVVDCTHVDVTTTMMR